MFLARTAKHFNNNRSSAVGNDDNNESIVDVSANVTVEGTAGDGIHVDQVGSLTAMELFGELLEMTEPDSPLHVASRWLLNVMYMTIGGYPDDVPRRQRVGPGLFASQEEFPRFTDIAPQRRLKRRVTRGRVASRWPRPLPASQSASPTRAARPMSSSSTMDRS